MAVINAAEMLDNLAEAMAVGERAAVAKLGITPDDFRLLMNAFDGSPVHALHNRMICEVRSEAWRILFNVAVNSHPVDEFAKIRAKTPTDGWVQCFNIVCVGDVEALQHEIVLMKMFQ